MRPSALHRWLPAWSRPTRNSLSGDVSMLTAASVGVLAAPGSADVLRLVVSQPQRQFVAAATRTGLQQALGPLPLFDSPERALAAVCQGFKGGPGYGTLAPPVAGPIPPGLNKETRR